MTNPVAGGGRGLATGARVASLLAAAGHGVVDVTSGSAAQARDRALSAVAGGVDAVVVVGGDGMVHLGAGLCAGTDVPLGIVPAGTGNDVARGLGLPVGNVEAAASVVLAMLGAAPRRIDAVRITGGTQSGWFVGVLGAGFDAVVNERANGWAWPRGRMRYNLAIARELPLFRPLRYRLVIDGIVEDRSAMLVAVANAPSYGGGMRIAPDARFDDGLLDVFVLEPVSTYEFLRIFPTVFRGGHVGHPRVSLRRARCVQVQALDVAVVGYADGERIGPLPLRCEVVPGALSVLAPLSPP